jgi:hypothetical protein
MAHTPAQGASPNSLLLHIAGLATWFHMAPRPARLRSDSAEQEGTSDLIRYAGTMMRPEGRGPAVPSHSRLRAEGNRNVKSGWKDLNLARRPSARPRLALPCSLPHFQDSRLLLQPLDCRQDNLDE